MTVYGAGFDKAIYNEKKFSKSMDSAEAPLEWQPLIYKSAIFG